MYVKSDVVYFGYQDGRATEITREEWESDWLQWWKKVTKAS